MKKLFLVCVGVVFVLQSLISVPEAGACWDFVSRGIPLTRSSVIKDFFKPGGDQRAITIFSTILAMIGGQASQAISNRFREGSEGEGSRESAMALACRRIVTVTCTAATVIGAGFLEEEVSEQPLRFQVLTEEEARQFGLTSSELSAFNDHVSSVNAMIESAIALPETASDEEVKALVSDSLSDPEFFSPEALNGLAKVMAILSFCANDAA